MNGAELYQQILFYARALWRRRWYGIAVAWFVCIAGWIWVAKMPDVYQSSARVYVDTDTMLGPLMKGLAVDTNIFRQVDITQRTLLSRPNLEKVARMTDLDLKVEGASDMERLLDQLQANISIKTQGANLFTVSHTSADPDLAKRVVQALLTIFVESNLGASRKDMDQARRFIDEQIRNYEEQLSAAEDRVAQFKRDNMNELPGREGDYYARMEAARTELATAKAQLDETEIKRDNLKQQLDEIPQFYEFTDANAAGGLGSNGPESNLELRALEIQQTIDQLLLRYTDNHPDVVAARRLLKSINEKLDAEENAAADAMAASGPPDWASASDGVPKIKTANPVYQQIKLALVDVEATVAILKKRVAQTKINIKQYETSARLVIGKETALARLNRDYSILKKNYEEMLGRRESAKIAQDLETKANKIQFRVIDPPKVPVKPSGPNRLLFLSAVLIGGLGAGAAFAFVLSQIDDSIPSTARLKEIFTLPILGAVSAIISTADRRRRVFELSSFALISLGLVGAYGGLVAVELFGIVDRV